MKPTLATCLTILALAHGVEATEFHVAITGQDTNPGSSAAPLRTIQHAADLAQPGDAITVHAGVYRERINPPRGGESDARRIVYQAAPGEKVEIRGSEAVTGWTKVGGEVWMAIIPNTVFGAFNPYSDLIHGSWFVGNKRPHHTGAVYLDGQWLAEAATQDAVMKPAESECLWFGQVDGNHTTLWAQFKGTDPNQHEVEINVRQSVFYPDKVGRDWITVRGFVLRNAATPWAPPNVEQIGLIGPNWSKGWIIENNTISHATCSGISLGKYDDKNDRIKVANNHDGYVGTIRRALENGWNRETVGHHLVRNNTISHCEQTGICGSLGAIFSRIENNTIHDIHVRQLFTGAEMAGIKLHAAIDVIISGNHVHHCNRAVWLDWMAQGTRVTGNLFHDNSEQDLYVEVNHGPFLVDNNLLLSAMSLRDKSEGGAYVHNLFAGTIFPMTTPSETPFHPAHGTAISGLAGTTGGDDRFINNLFVGPVSLAPTTGTTTKATSGLCVYDRCKNALLTGGNVYSHGAKPHAKEIGQLERADLDLQPRLVQDGTGVQLHLNLDPSMLTTPTALVTSDRLGKTKVSQLGYVNPDDSPLTIDHDFLGNPRGEHPTPGPFERPGSGQLNLTLR